MNCVSKYTIINSAPLFLIKIRLFQSLENHFVIFRVFRQVRFEQRPYLQIIDRAAFHRLQIFVLRYVLPVQDHAQRFFEHLVEPYPHGASVSLHEGMRDVHFHVFRDDFLKGSLRHFFYRCKGFPEIKAVREAEISFRDILVSYFARKWV